MELSKSVTAALISVPKTAANSQSFIPNCRSKWRRVTTTKSWVIVESRLRRCQYNLIRKCPLRYLENIQLTLLIIALKSIIVLQVLRLILLIIVKHPNNLVRKGTCTLEKTRALVMALLPFVMDLKAILSNNLLI